MFEDGREQEAGRICLQNKSFTLHPIGVENWVLSGGLLNLSSWRLRMKWWTDCCDQLFPGFKTLQLSLTPRVYIEIYRLLSKSTHHIGGSPYRNCFCFLGLNGSRMCRTCQVINRTQNCSVGQRNKELYDWFHSFTCSQISSFPLLLFLISCLSLLVFLFFLLVSGFICSSPPLSHSFFVTHSNLPSLLCLTQPPPPPPPPPSTYLTLLLCPSLTSLHILRLFLFLCSYSMAFHVFWKKSFLANICPTVSVEPSESIWAQPGSTRRREGEREIEREREREGKREGSVHKNRQCRNNRDLGFSVSVLWLK